MTHALHTRQSLQSLKLIELKAIASQTGATPADRRSIESHIEAILKRQPQPQPLPPTIEDCQTLTGTKTLGKLRDYLSERKLSQCQDCQTLYRNILNYQLRFAVILEPLESGWIDEELRATAETSEVILDELEITFIDLSIGTDLVVPNGLDAYHAVYNGRVIVEVYNYKGGYVVRRGDGVVYDDPYSAIVNQYERYNPGAVLLARMSIERDKEIEAEKAAMMPEYA